MNCESGVPYYNLCNLGVHVSYAESNNNLPLKKDIYISLISYYGMQI